MKVIHCLQASCAATDSDSEIAHGSRSRIFGAGERHRDNVLQAIGSSLEAWVTQVKREKAIYHVLNMCSVDVTRKVLVAEAWCPVSAKPRVQEALREAAHTTSASVSPCLPSVH